MNTAKHSSVRTSRTRSSRHRAWTHSCLLRIRPLGGSLLERHGIEGFTPFLSALYKEFQNPQQSHKRDKEKNIPTNMHRLKYKYILSLLFLLFISVRGYAQDISVTEFYLDRVRGTGTLVRCHMHIKKRPAHLSIVERLGGFSWCKGTTFI